MPKIWRVGIFRLQKAAFWWTSLGIGCELQRQRHQTLECIFLRVDRYPQRVAYLRTAARQCERKSDRRELIQICMIFTRRISAIRRRLIPILTRRTAAVLIWTLRARIAFQTMDSMRVLYTQPVYRATKHASVSKTSPELRAWEWPTTHPQGQSQSAQKRFTIFLLLRRQIWTLWTARMNHKKSNASTSYWRIVTKVSKAWVHSRTDKIV